MRTHSAQRVLPRNSRPCATSRVTPRQPPPRIRSCGRGTTRRRRWPWPLSAGALAVAAVLALIGFVMMRARSTACSSAGDEIISAEQVTAEEGRHATAASCCPLSALNRDGRANFSRMAWPDTCLIWRAGDSSHNMACCTLTPHPSSPDAGAVVASSFEGDYSR
jgi:hypothetical protein